LAASLAASGRHPPEPIGEKKPVALFLKNLFK